MISNKKAKFITFSTISHYTYEASTKARDIGVITH